MSIAVPGPAPGNKPSPTTAPGIAPTLDRRTMLVGAGAAGAVLLGYPLIKNLMRSPIPVFLASGQSYDARLEQTIRDGLIATGIIPAAMKGKRVLLKPNLVEPTRAAPHLTTHPEMVRATTEVFRKWDAEVAVGEAPGHVRDTEMALHESGLGAALDADAIPFRDLNYEVVDWIKNRGRMSSLAGFYFPKSVMGADLIVSMPKLKTHHWVGLTVSMKNLYGVIPGCKYGWPKNVLHHNGIPQTVVDINASLPKTIAVVDGILCMEGDGPIMGSPKHMGIVAVGTNPLAVDATCARIMGLEPSRVSYLKLADDKLGTINDRFIEQRGESWKKLVSPFAIIDQPHLRPLVTSPGVLTS